jgi:hypothetical protein
MYVVFIHGPFAAGKHTVGMQLSSLLGIPLFHNHLAVDTALTLFPFGTPAFRRVRAAIWLASFAEAAAAERSFIFTFSPESTVEPRLIDEMVRSVTDRNGNVFFVELRCSRDATLRRLGNESRAKFGKLTDSAVYIALESQNAFAFPPLPKPIASIDTETVSPMEGASRIAELLKVQAGAA